MVGRLFVSALLPWDNYTTTARETRFDLDLQLEYRPSLHNTVLLTTDADIWPFSRNMFSFPRGKSLQGLQMTSTLTAYLTHMQP